MVKIFALVVMLLYPFIPFAQNDSLVTISGIIKDSINTPVQNAVVKFKLDSSGTNITAFTFSKADGRYLLQVPKIDSGYIEISSIGYATLVKKIIFQKRNEEKRDFILSFFDSFLPAVSVIASPKIIQKKDTIVFNAEQYKRENQQNIEDLLRTMPGFQINENGKLTFNGQAIDRVLIENDDLFGGDYVPLTQNITPDKIRQIEVITNYKDNSDLSQRLNAGSEQVVNLKFNKTIAKIFGSIDAGVPTRRYNSKANVISLIPKAKFVTIGNVNSTGNLASFESDMLSSNSAKEGNAENLNFLKKTWIPDIYVPNLLDPLWTRLNHSAYFSTNAQFNITRSFMLKAIAQLGGNKYSQSESSVQSFHDSTNPLIIKEFNKIYKKNTFNHFQVYGRYSSGTRMQLTNTLDVYNNKEIDSTNGFLQQIPSWQTLFGKLFYLKNELKATYVINSKSLITISDNLNYGTMPQEYAFSPLLSDSIFQVPGHSNHLFQDQRSQINNHVLSLYYSRKVNKGNFRIELGHKSSFHELFSFMQVIDSNNATTNLNPEFANSVKYTDRELYSNILFSSTVFNKLNYTISIKADVLTLFLDSTSNRNYFNKIYILPSLNLNYAFSNNSRLSFSYSTSTNSPEINRLYSGDIFTNFLRLEKGTRTLQAATNHRFNFNYNFAGLVNRGLLFFSGFIGQFNQSFYISNFNNREAYSFIQNEFYQPGISTSFFALFSFLQKTMPTIKSQVTFNATANTGKSITKYRSLLQINRFRGATVKFDYRSVFEKQFNFVSSGTYSLNYQKNLATGFRNTAQNVSLTQTVDYKILKTFHISSSINYLSVWGNLNKVENIVLINAAALFDVIPKQLSVKVAGNNLLNQKTFGSNSFTAFYSYTNNFDILKSFVTINVLYRF